MTDRDDITDRAEQIVSSIRDSDEESEPEGQPRREFLSNSAIAGGALLALGGGTGMALASEHNGEGEGEMPEGPEFDDVAGTDIDVLNYALSLEHLEAAFYREATEMFGEEDFNQSETLSMYSEAMRQAAWEHVQVAGEQEATHVEALSQVITMLGGEPVEEGNYNFGLESVEDFFSLAATLENTGVAAYAGAAPYIESPDLLKVALSIHSVEGRHAAFFNTLSGQSPFPSAFDEAMTQQEVMDVVSTLAEGEMPEETPGGTDTPGGNETTTEPPAGTDTPGGNETTTETDTGQ